MIEKPPFKVSMAIIGFHFYYEERNSHRIRTLGWMMILVVFIFTVKGV